MSFVDKLTALLPFGKKQEVAEYFFALNISNEKLTAALWQMEGKQLKILEVASGSFASLDDLANATDKLLDKVLGIREIEPQKILFGVPNSWLKDDNLKDENLKILRGLVKELELVPMAYVENDNALIHLLEKTEGIPPTAILVGFEKHHLTVTVVRAGKLDGVKTVLRGDNNGADIEKALLAFTGVETLPSKILIYGEDVSELKDQLLSFPWMSKLSFLHFPKIESLQDEVEIKSVCLAGASEMTGDDVTYVEHPVVTGHTKLSLLSEEEEEEKETKDHPDTKSTTDKIKDSVAVEQASGFIVGDVSEQVALEEEKTSLGELQEPLEEELGFPEEIEPDEDQLIQPPQTNMPAQNAPKTFATRFSLTRFLPKQFKSMAVLFGVIGVVLIILASYLLLPKATVKIFVEPKILEKDTQVTADPNQKKVDEDAKIIPGQLMTTEVSGSDKDSATGKKQIGDPAKGTIKIINNSQDSQTFSEGSTISANNLKFILDSTVNIASTSATSDSKSTKTVTVTAASVGADGNLPSGTRFSGLSSQVAIVAEGNFSGGNSKTVTVVSSDDQQRLLAKLSSTLRQQAQQKLQDQYKNKKILQEALAENIVKKSYSKNINDQAGEFSLNLTIDYKGTAFDDSDLKLIVSKLVTTDVPAGFELNLQDTETQSEVSKLEKDGRLIFLARFKAKMLPKLDTNKIKDQIKGKSLSGAEEIIKGMDNVLGSEITFSPSLPKFLQRMPLLSQNIKIEVGLK